MTSTSAPAVDERMALALKIDARIAKLVQQTQRYEARIALLLTLMDRDGLYLALCQDTLNSYASFVTGWDPSKTSRMVTLVRRLEKLPDMQRSFFAGEIPWTNACLAAEAAISQPDGDAVWTPRVKELSRAELKATYHAETGVPVKRRGVFEATEEEWAWIEDGLVRLRRESDRPIDLGQGIVQAFRRLLGHGPEGAAKRDAGPRPLVVLGVCTECATVTHNDATVTDPKTLDLVWDAEVVEIPSSPEVTSATTEPPGKTIPQRVTKKLDARDGSRCRVPGCRNRTWRDLHHEGGRKNVGHDPEHMITLCPKHHVARHLGLLKIVFDGGLATFSRADGVVLGEVNLRALPRTVHRSDRRHPREHVAVAPAHDMVPFVPAHAAIAEDARKPALHRRSSGF